MDSEEVPERASSEGIVAKQRLKWTRQLHEMFVVAVSQLGGADSKLIDSTLLNFVVEISSDSSV